MTEFADSESDRVKYDIIHFEALGGEAAHLEAETLMALQQKLLPEKHSWLITPDTVQEWLNKHPTERLPDLISTKTHSQLPENYLTGSKKGIITRSAGFDHFEHIIKNANVTSLLEYCVNAVAQTAIKFLYAAAGELNLYQKNCATFERAGSTPFMELNPSRTVTIFGVGKIGKRIHDLAKANCLTTFGVDIRNAELNRQYNGQVQFISIAYALQHSDIIINAMNLTRDRGSVYFNENYFCEQLLEQAEKRFIFINITRGEIAPEETLLKLYDSGKIVGLGLDVFSDESGFADTLNNNCNKIRKFEASKELLKRSLERSANIYVQPHQGFNSDLALKTKAAEAIKHVISWYRNNGKNFDLQLPYY